ncbi:hypothetical protein HYV85_06660 [Candidatus Woesearchaeota archaeon]|nr:hypothetical protein [Candidatus Woesearchaeota archaeon]
MVEAYTGMILFFEGNGTGKGKKFLKLLHQRWPDAIVVGNDTDQGIEIKMKIAEFREPRYILFHLISGPIPSLGRASVLSFEPYTMDYSYTKEIDLIHEIFLAACTELKPVYGSAHATMSELHRPLIDQAEYYQNPYLFCVEPPLFFSDFSPEAFHNFLHDGGLAAKLAEIEKVMPRDELVELIRKHVEKIVTADDGGVGILKNKVPQPSYPRYFIRQELRRRGVQLPDGLAESYAMKFEIKG